MNMLRLLLVIALCGSCVLAQQKTPNPGKGKGQGKGQKAGEAPKKKPDRGVPAEQIPDADPAKEQAALKLLDGFEINLYASDPMIAKPIHMNFDAAGRLWVVSSALYPQIKPGEKADDKVVVLEDSDGDGKADKSTLFAGGLLIPTGIEVGDGGCYVGNSTELIHLKDTDGDGEADQRRIVLSGFGTEDTHHLIHTLRWGVDGRLYFNQSIYIHSRVETPWGPVSLQGGGIWRFMPETMRLQVVSRGLVNPWGHHQDQFGQHFATDGAGGDGINYAFNGSTFTTAVGAKRIMSGLNPGQPKHAGMEFITGRHVPDSLRGNIITNDFRGHRVNRFILTEDGSGYASRQREDLIVTDHVAFRPIDVKMGPDGAIYIADWYNPIINHGEVDFRDPRRDHVHGRIWRITAKGSPLVKPPKLVGAPVADLLDALKMPEGWTREKARRVLKERGASEVAPALETWVKQLDASQAADAERYRLEALWIYQAIDKVHEPLLRRLLASSDHRIRAAAVPVLMDWQDRLSQVDDLLARAIRDEHPRVRLEALNALRDRQSELASRLALEAMDKPVDVNLDFALWLTMRETEAHWLSKTLADPNWLTGDFKKLLFALKSVDKPEAVRPLVAMIRAGKIPAEDRQATLEWIASQGAPEDLRVVFELASASNPAVDRSILLGSLVTAARSRNLKPAGDLSAIATLFASEEETHRAAAARLAGYWKLERFRADLVKLAEDQASSPAIRQAGIEGLGALGGEETKSSLLAMTKPEKPLELRLSAIGGLAAIDVNLAARRAVDVMSDAPSGTETDYVWDALIGRKGGPQALVAALNEQKLPTDIATEGLRKLSMSGQKSPGLENALQKAGGSLQMPQQLTLEQMQAMVAKVRNQGDPVKGQEIFRRASLLCTNCHAIAGAGGQVGPDLSSIGASAPVDYLVESILEPSKKIKEGFHAVVVTKKDGAINVGVMMRKTDRDLLLRDAADNEMTIPLDQIASQVNNPVSLMPPGITAQLRQDEFVDLVRFMGEIGKPGALAVPKERFVRRWRALEANAEFEDLLRQGSIALAASDHPKAMWRPAYSAVDGSLPVDDLPQLSRFFGRKFSYARFQIEASAPGAAVLKIESPKGLSMWVGSVRTDADAESKITLAKGINTITLAVDRVDHDKPLKIELIDAAGSPAQARLITGK